MPDTFYHITNNEREMQFEIELEAEKAYLTYRFNKQNIALMHTFVPETLEGRGIAGKLATEAFKYAEQQNKLVIIYCTFVAGFVKRHPEYRKQLDPEYHR